MKEIGVQPAEAMMVGDRRDSDVMAGKLAGTRTVWIRSEYREGPGADHTIASLATLPALVDRLAKQGS
jgi:FMN phosphatase YigB (HAD superfamily)